MRIMLEKIRLSSVDGPDPCWGKPGGRFSGGYLDIGWGASALLMVFDPHRLARTCFNKNGRNWRESRDVQDVLRPTLRTGPFVSAAPWWLKQVTGPNQSQGEQSLPLQRRSCEVVLQKMGIQGGVRNHGHFLQSILLPPFW